MSGCICGSYSDKIGIQIPGFQSQSHWIRGDEPISGDSIYLAQGWRKRIEPSSASGRPSIAHTQTVGALTKSINTRL